VTQVIVHCAPGVTVRVERDNSDSLTVTIDRAAERESSALTPDSVPGKDEHE